MVEVVTNITNIFSAWYIAHGSSCGPFKEHIFLFKWKKYKGFFICLKMKPKLFNLQNQFETGVNNFHLGYKKQPVYIT